MRRLVALLTILATSDFSGSAFAAASASDAVTGPAIGTVAPEFTARNLMTGDKIDLMAERGKLVIVTFWATWCGPCKRELPILEHAQQLVGKDKLTVLAINFRDQPESVAALRRLVKDWKITFVEDRGERVARQYKITAIPHLFMVNKDGQVVANHLGYGDSSINELVDDINKAFRGSAVAGPEPSATPPEPPSESPAQSTDSAR